MSDGSRKLKAKKLGVLMRDARQAAKKSLEECATIIGIPSDVLESYELGEQSPSLPELEVLSYYLRVPVAHFWEDGLIESGASEADFDIKRLVVLRQKIIGVLLRKFRTEKGLTPQALAESIGIEADRLQAYEMGETPIPVPDLEALALALGWHIKAFQDRQGPVGTWHTQRQNFTNFMSLTPEMQDFISKPINHSYLEIARRMSEMSVDKLRNIAEVLLEITL